jgi:hypothetical protein
MKGWRQGTVTENGHDKNSIWAIQLSWLGDKVNKVCWFNSFANQVFYLVGKVNSIIVDSIFNPGSSFALFLR